ncbi:hypothetical protein Dimus_006198, partial [Dionaea muscipula]
ELLVKDVDTLVCAIRDDIPRSLQNNIDHIEASLKGVVDDTKTHFELMESKLKVTDLDLSMKITMAEGNLGQKIDLNTTIFSSVEETLAGLLKAQQEQNKTNKALTELLMTPKLILN